VQYRLACLDPADRVCEGSATLRRHGHTLASSQFESFADEQPIFEMRLSHAGRRLMRRQRRLRARLVLTEGDAHSVYLVVLRRR
jgi:hypothetical protein